MPGHAFRKFEIGGAQFMRGAGPGQREAEKQKGEKPCHGAALADGVKGSIVTL